mgnify:CR=1 FL=1
MASGNSPSGSASLSILLNQGEREFQRSDYLAGDSLTFMTAGDFDGDGRLDLAVSCHTRDGNHYTNSKVFYNDGNRFANPRVTLLPTHGTHDGPRNADSDQIESHIICVDAGCAIDD